jgi:hypothetical protein
VVASGATGESGPWLITLDMPSYLPAMQFLEVSAGAAIAAQLLYAAPSHLVCSIRGYRQKAQAPLSYGMVHGLGESGRSRHRCLMGYKG